MKIKWGALIVDGRGKIGGQVASKNRGGAYLRTKVTPVNPQTAAQTAVRALFGSLSQQWSGLTAAVRAGFDNAVNDWSTTNIFGDIKNPTGKNLYSRLNLNAQGAGYAAVTSAPAKLDMVQGIVTKVEYENQVNSDIILTGAYTGPDARVVLFATPQLSEGTTFVKNKLRKIYSAVANAYDDAAAFTAYTNKFGQPDDGSNVYFGIKYVLPNGQASPMQVIKGTITN